jgi:hypothetical protein
MLCTFSTTLVVSGLVVVSWGPPILSALRQLVCGAGLITPYPLHGPYDTMGIPQYKDGTSMAALELNNASGSLWQQTGDVYGQSSLRCGNRLAAPV